MSIKLFRYARGAVVTAAAAGLFAAVPGSPAGAASSGIDLCARVAAEAGFTGNGLVTAIAVAMAESRCVPTATYTNTDSHRSVDRGLWQINDYWHPEVSDECAFEPQCNADAAYQISSRGTNWQPWSTYNSGSYSGFLDDARAAVARLQPKVTEGSFVRVNGTDAVYRIVGGAPVYVSTFAPFGSPTVIGISAAQLDGMRDYPVDGVFVESAQTGAAYRIAGGAPVYVASWAAFGGPQPTIAIDQTAIDRAGTGGLFNHLRQRPLEGTFLRGNTSGQVYRVAGGAPIYVTSWTGFGGAQPVVNVDDAALGRAGEAGVWSHLRARPADGTFIRGNVSGAVYRIAGGAPIYVSTWDAFGGGQPSISVDDNAIGLAGEPGVYAHLNARPTDGTFVRAAQNGAFYRFAGGAPLYVSTWDAYGGQGPAAYTTVDQAALDRAGEPGVWAHLNARPVNGTFLHSGQTGQVYRVVGGAPIYVSNWSVFGGQQPYTTVDQAALDRAGESGVWSHLSYRPANGTLLTTAPGGAKYSVSNGRALPYTGTATIPATNTIDKYALDHAGQSGPLNHLLP